MANPTDENGNSEVIHDGNMRVEMHSDLKEHYNMTNTQAKLFIDEHGDEIISAMWDEYSFRMAHIIEQNGLGN